MRIVLVRVLVPALVALAAACTSGPQPMDSTSHDQEILAWRASKDQMFRLSSESPLTPADRLTFSSLPYYPISESYRMPSILKTEASASPQIIELPTSTTEMRRMQRVGTLSFTFQGTRLALTAFAEEDDRAINRLFVPFRDQTSGTETYGGGRYLELDRTSTGMYDLDFNRAYHPYCVYNPNYVCPVPPPENTLSVAIRAGERLDPSLHR